MIRINGLTEGLELFKTLGSEARMQIIELLAKEGPMNLNEIAQALNLTNGALTGHVRRLEECGIIKVKAEHTGRGLQKICSLGENQILLNIHPQIEERSSKVYETELQIGHYSNYAVLSPCGLADSLQMLAQENDPRVFSYPQHLDAEILWFHDGYIEYRIPNLLPENQRIVQLTISLEMSSADQGAAAESGSLISFALNDQPLCSWITEPEINSRGIYTPLWWKNHQCQHGHLKMLVINEMGIFIDGVKAQEPGTGWTFLDSHNEMRLRIETHPFEGHDGGVAIYGSSFGNYKQNIQAIVHYVPEDLFAE
jgi:predicted transcriptional regulator